MSDHPPKPRFALAVGVIGHRPNRLPKNPTALTAIEAEVARVLDQIVEAVSAAHEGYRDRRDRAGVFTCARPALSLVSALAEGADRIAARTAIAKGFALDAPLPFPADEYSKDFLPNEPKGGEATDLAAEEERSRKSIAEFTRLIGPDGARSVLELPGTRKNASDPDDPDAKKAYEAVGLTVLGQSDILLAIWDGGASAGRGGTTEMLNVAARLGIPIIHIDAKGGEATCVRWSALNPHPYQVNMVDDLPAKQLDRTQLQSLVENLIRPPSDPAEIKALTCYLDECFRRLNGWLAFPLLMSLFRVRPLRRTDWRPQRLEDLSAEYTKLASPDPTSTMAAAASPLARAFAWSDAIGTRFGQVFRSAVVTNFLLAACAVLAVAVSLTAHDITVPGALDQVAEHKRLFVTIEMLFVVAVLLNTMVGRRLGWHRRWLEAREVAERLRVALPLWTLGARPAIFAGPEPAWTGWYVRAIIRDLGLRAGAVDPEILRAAYDTLRRLLVDQRNYHETTASRMRGLGYRLERAGEVLFALTLVAAIAFLAALMAARWHVTAREAYLVAALAAGLPALATALYGIRVIGDFEGVAKRSHRTSAALGRLIDALDHDWPVAVRDTTPPNFALLRARARAAADAMLGDVENWRLAAESRDLAIPG
jgi:hypothetical protein